MPLLDLSSSDWPVDPTTILAIGWKQVSSGTGFSICQFRGCAVNMGASAGKARPAVLGKPAVAPVRGCFGGYEACVPDGRLLAEPRRRRQFNRSMATEVYEHAAKARKRVASLLSSAPSRLREKSFSPTGHGPACNSSTKRKRVVLFEAQAIQFRAVATLASGWVAPAGLSSSVDFTSEKGCRQ